MGHHWVTALTWLGFEGKGQTTDFFVKQRRLNLPATFLGRFKIQDNDQIMVYDGSTDDSAYVQECRIAQHGDQIWEMYDL